jgi:hypothetical protein
MRKAKMGKAKMLFGLRKGGKGCRDWQAEQNRDEVRRQTEVPDHPGIYVCFLELLDTSQRSTIVDDTTTTTALCSSKDPPRKKQNDYPERQGSSPK